MAILSQRNTTTRSIYAPIFTDTPDNRVQLLDYMAQLDNTFVASKMTGKELHGAVVNGVFEQYGADYLIQSQIVADLIPSSDGRYWKVAMKAWWEDSRLLMELARCLRKESNDFAVFAALFEQFAVTLSSLKLLLEKHRKFLRKYGLNYDDVIERIEFVENATEDNFANAVPLLMGFVGSLSQYYFSSRDLDTIEELRLLDTNDAFWRNYQFDFGKFYLKMDFENQLNYGAEFVLESDIAVCNFDFSSAEYEQNEAINGSLVKILRSLINAALRGDSAKMQRILASALSLKPIASNKSKWADLRAKLDVTTQSNDNMATIKDALDNLRSIRDNRGCRS